MAAPTDIVQTGNAPARDDVRIQLNNVIAALRIITAKLDADAGVTDTNYFALSMDSTIATGPAKVNVQ
jgi:hypothetical protein